MPRLLSEQTGGSILARCHVEEVVAANENGFWPTEKIQNHNSNQFKVF